MDQVSSDTPLPIPSQCQNQSFDSQVPQSSHNQSTTGAHATNDGGVSALNRGKQSQDPTRKVIKPIQMKRKRRQSSGSTMLASHIGNMVNTCSRALEILESDVNPHVSEDTPGRMNNVQIGSKVSTVDMAMDVVNRMVIECGLVKGSEMWCFLIHLLEDGVRRELFLKMEDDDSRMAWYIMDIEKRRNKKRKLFWIMATSTTAALSTYYYKYIYKEPCMTSNYRGEDWMMEVLNGHHIRCVNAFRMESSVFRQLCEDLQMKHGLQESNRMSIIEKVGIFIYTIALGVSNRDVAERFQRSGETVSRAFHEVLEAISGRNRGYMGLACDIIKPMDSTFEGIPLHIANDERYMPYFKDCIGCTAGTHIEACIPEADQLSYIGRKGVPTFNAMGVCDFDMCFTFISVGSAGIAHDSRVFLHAINTPDRNFSKPPDGRYYLVDKGYPDRNGYLVPYSKTRYHKKQFQNEPPGNFKEAFNKVHWSLRSCIEMSFEVLNKRWKILKNMPKFRVETQLDIMMATFALHYYIRKNSNDDLLFGMLEQFPDYITR